MFFYFPHIRRGSKQKREKLLRSQNQNTHLPLSLSLASPHTFTTFCTVRSSLSLFLSLTHTLSLHSCIFSIYVVWICWFLFHCCQFGCGGNQGFSPSSSAMRGFLASPFSIFIVNVALRLCSVLWSSFWHRCCRIAAPFAVFWYLNSSCVIESLNGCILGFPFVLLYWGFFCGHWGAVSFDFQWWGLLNLHLFKVKSCV